MRSKIPLLGITVYLALLVGLFLLLFFFNRPVADFQSIAFRSKVLATLSNEKIEKSPELRSLRAMLSAYSELKDTPTFCLTDLNLFPRNSDVPLSFSTKVTVDSGDTSLRKNLWSLKAKGISQASCPLSQSHLLKRISSTRDTESYNSILLEQWNRLEKTFHSEYLLFEVDLRLPDSESRSQSYLLSLGLINGTSLVLLDGRVIGYFLERVESNRVLNVDLVPHKTSRLSIVNFGRGYSVPGIAHMQFVGLIKHDSRRVDLFEDTTLRNARSLFTIVFVAFLSFVLFIFGALQPSKFRWPIYLSVGLSGFTLSTALQLDHVQSILNDSNIQFVRNVYICTMIFSIVGVSRELADRLEVAYQLLVFDRRISMPRLTIQNINILNVVFGLAFWPIVLHSLVEYVKLYLRHSPRLYVAQYAFLQTILNFSFVYGMVLLIMGAILTMARRSVSEDSETLQVQSASRLCFAAGLSFLLYTTSYASFLSQWLLLNKVPTLQMLLGSQTMALFVAFSILLLMAKTLREQSLVHRILPESIKALLQNGVLEKDVLDRTATEFNWIVLNDISKSSVFKMANLAVVTHMLQSIFHKLHKDYLKDSIDWVNSIGDAILLTVKSPPRSQSNDPVLEKLVRCYALHVDGVRQFKRSYETIQAMLRIQNHELYLATKDRENDRQGAAAHLGLGFRTILTADYYFYGLNHELSNIDSKAIYVVSKAEKLLETSENNSFIIFPDLMTILTTCFGEIDSYFVACPINKERAQGHLSAYLPDSAFVLRPDRREQFEAFLQRHYGRAIYLRSSPDDSQRSYVTVSEQVESFCSKVKSEVSSLAELVSLVQVELPGCKNFIEKDTLLQAICNAAARFEFWKDERNHEELKRLLAEIGYPGKHHVDNIARRDHERDPKQLLEMIRSQDPIKRNKAVRLLRLARTQTKFRPTAMSDSTFVRELLSVYLDRAEHFSVESHIYIYRYLCGDESRRSDILRETMTVATQLKRFERVLEVLMLHPAKSLHRLPELYRKVINGTDSSDKAA